MSRNSAGLFWSAVTKTCRETMRNSKRRIIIAQRTRPVWGFPNGGPHSCRLVGIVMVQGDDDRCGRQCPPGGDPGKWSGHGTCGGTEKSRLICGMSCEALLGLPITDSESKMVFRGKTVRRIWLKPPIFKMSSKESQLEYGEIHVGLCELYFLW